MVRMAYDASIRPNQIFAVSLPHSPLSASDQRSVVRVCRRRRCSPLLDCASLGARRLRPIVRATAVRAGARRRLSPRAVWGWLLDPSASLCIASRRCRGSGSFDGVDARRARRSGRGHDIGEIFDGDPPHHPAAPPHRPGRSRALWTHGACSGRPEAGRRHRCSVIMRNASASRTAATAPKGLAALGTVS